MDRGGDEEYMKDNHSNLVVRVDILAKSRLGEVSLPLGQ